MRKKFFKYIKLIFCISLILSLVTPSYAVLQSTDGSVLVTKAEFDTAMANFNSKLTTFESSVNSKIDSQVTSYLDKNGIWSGKKQTTYNSEEKTMQYIENDIYNYYDSLRVSSTNPEHGFINDELYTATKSGLAYTVFRWNVDWGIEIIGAVNDKLSQGYLKDISFIYEQNDETKVTTKVNVFNLWQTEANSWQWVCSYSGLKADKPFLYFVTNGVKYSLKAGYQFLGRTGLPGTNGAPGHGADVGSSYDGKSYTEYGILPQNDTVRKVQLIATTEIY